jgi:hypothetical protein
VAETKSSSGKKAAKKGSRCWPGFEPVPGKAPFTKGSCKPEDESTGGAKKKSAEKKSSTKKAASKKTASTKTAAKKSATKSSAKKATKKSVNKT